MSTDPNFYRYYICNLQSPKMKARELRITKSAEFEKLTTKHVTADDIITPNATVDHLAVTEDAFVQGDFIVSGDITSGTIHSVDIDGSGTLTNRGDSILRGRLQVSDSSFLHSTNVIGELYVGGPTVLDGQVTMLSTTTADNIITNSISTQNIKGNPDIASPITIDGTTTFNEIVSLSKPPKGFTSNTNFPATSLQIGYTIKQANPTSVFAPDGTNRVINTVTLPIGVWYMKGQIRVICTPLNTATVDKIGLNITDPVGISISLTEDRTNFAKSISDHTYFSYSISDVVYVTTSGTYTLNGYVNHTGTTTNVQTSGTAVYNYFSATRIA